MIGCGILGRAVIAITAVRGRGRGVVGGLAKNGRRITCACERRRWQSPPYLRDEVANIVDRLISGPVGKGVKETEGG